MMTAQHPASGRRLLVVANETVASETLHAAVRSQIADLASTRVFVVAPALSSRLRHWFSDTDRARVAAVRRLQACVEALDRAGVEAEGLIGDSDPLLAVRDALRIFPADRLIVATLPEGRSNWLARNLVSRVREQFRLPTTHIVVDLKAEQAAPHEPLAA
jgi:hypothetical protein